MDREGSEIESDLEGPMTKFIGQSLVESLPSYYSYPIINLLSLSHLIFNLAGILYCKKVVTIAIHYTV